MGMFLFLWCLVKVKTSRVLKGRGCRWCDLAGSLRLSSDNQCISTRSKGDTGVVSDSNPVKRAGPCRQPERTKQPTV